MQLRALVPTETGKLLKFPSDPNSRGQWSNYKEVKRTLTRDHWSGTSNYSVLCEKHLTADSFKPDSAIAAPMGLANRKRLKYGAIPRATAEAASLGG